MAPSAIVLNQRTLRTRNVVDTRRSSGSHSVKANRSSGLGISALMLLEACSPAPPPSGYAWQPASPYPAPVGQETVVIPPAQPSYSYYDPNQQYGAPSPPDVQVAQPSEASQQPQGPADEPAQDASGWSTAAKLGAVAVGLGAACYVVGCLSGHGSSGDNSAPSSGAADSSNYDSREADALLRRRNEASPEVDTHDAYHDVPAIDQLHDVSPGVGNTSAD